MTLFFMFERVQKYFAPIKYVDICAGDHSTEGLDISLLLESSSCLKEGGKCGAFPFKGRSAVLVE